MGGMYILDNEGNPIPERQTLAWGNWMETADRGVALTRIAPGISVSTVFLGLDHALDGPPLLYETMVFGGPNDQDQARYSTREEALEGHEEMVKQSKAAVEVIETPCPYCTNGHDPGIECRLKPQEEER